MLKHVLYASAALALLAAPSLAAPVTGTLNVSGTVVPQCVMPAASQSIALGTLTIDAATGNAASATGDFTQTGVTWCNGANSTRTVTLYPLTTSAMPPTGSSFVNLITYTVTGLSTLPLGSGTNTAGTVAVNAENVGAFFDSASHLITVVSDATTAPVMAGAYAGRVEVVLTPSL